MSGMLNALLDINQIEAGAVKPKWSPFLSNELFDKLSERIHLRDAQARDLSLRMVLPSGADLSSDPRLLEQMVRNLVWRTR